MTSGVEHIAQLAQGELTKGLSEIKHKLHDVKLVFDWHWIVGCCIALFAAVSSNTGLNLQRLSHLENQFYDPFKRKKPRPQAEQTTMFVRPRWLIGIALMILASVADFAALSFAAQSLVASLGSLSLVANALIAPLIVKEKITSREWKAIALICIGDCCCILFGQHKSEVYTLEGLMSLYEQPAFAVYAVIVTIYILVVWVSIQLIESTYSPRTSNQAGGEGDGVGEERDHSIQSSSRGLGDKEEESDGKGGAEVSQYAFVYDPRSCVAKYHRISHAMLSGVIGAQSVLLGKSTAELIKTMIAGRGMMFAHVGTYIILVCMFLAIFCQVHYLNEALKRVEATIVVPIFQTFWTLVSVCGGFVFYKEYMDLRFAQVAMFCFGLMLTVIGIHMMTKRPPADLQDAGGKSKSSKGSSKKRRKKSSRKSRSKRKTYRDRSLPRHRDLDHDARNIAEQSAGTGSSYSGPVHEAENTSSHVEEEEKNFGDIDTDGAAGKWSDEASTMPSTGESRHLVRSPSSLHNSHASSVGEQYTSEDPDADSFSERDCLLPSSGGASPYTGKRPSRVATHSHMASACSFPGMLIDSAARTKRRPLAIPTPYNIRQRSAPHPHDPEMWDEEDCV